MISSLSVSVVVYRSPPDTLAATLDSLVQAVEIARQDRRLGEVSLALINNDPLPNSWQPLWTLLSRPSMAVFQQRSLYDGHGNVGYGRGHNRALCRGQADFHLVLNPDVLIDHQALSEGLYFMANHADAGLLAPQVEGADGQQQYLCKRHPTVMVLMLRAFAPISLRKKFIHMLDHYEMRDLVKRHEIIWDVPIVSGCFMLFRASMVHRVGGFAPQFFLYFEDFDLSLRFSRVGRTVQIPSVHIVHLGGQAARKGLRHILWFGSSMVRFFYRHGWRWY